MFGNIALDRAKIVREDIRVSGVEPFDWKRPFDLIVATLLLIVLSPLLLLVSALIYLDSPGPILFRQDRFTVGRRVFKVYKFRTMRCAEPAQAPGRLCQTLPDDPRTTRVGRFLRRTSIDELPQLFNVIAGDMSVVGPRAHATNMSVEGVAFHDLFPLYHDRHVVRPGITGWAQVNSNRGIVETIEKARDRLHKDLYYVDHASTLLDLKILALTAWRVPFDRNAF